MLTSVVLGVACMGCLDAESPTLTPPAPGVPWLSARLECTVDRASASMVCTEPHGESKGGPSRALLSGGAIKMRSANFVADSISEIWAFDATAQNLLSYAVGTPDGQTKTGLKVFFETGPTGRFATPGDTGTVTVGNPDGHQNFTAAQQPYHFYDTILSPQAVTDPKRWEFTVPRNVSGFSFTVRIFTTTPREQRVPIRAPQGVPRWLYAPQNSVPCQELFVGPCLPNVVSVLFHESSSQEERQSAVDHISGTVVGGTNGMYHVQLPSDTTLTRLRAAIVHMRSLPQVRYAGPFSTGTFSGDHLTPVDTITWRRWQLNPDSADDSNWALEQIGAPFAWGCSTGDSTTLVAVVDDGFHDVSDLRRQVHAGSSFGFPTTGSKNHDHGTRVAGVLAAYGNDSTQITGVMWRARLMVRNAAVDSAGVRISPTGVMPDQVWGHLRSAGEAGARVINLSTGWLWTSDPALEPDSMLRLGNDAAVRGWYMGFKAAMDSLAARDIRPLIVFSAGNQGHINTKWNPARIAVDSTDQFGVPYNILIVGASNVNQQIASFSAPGAGIAAPGEDVPVLHGDGRLASTDSSRQSPFPIHTGYGTSFAAPHVAGVAGLIFAFDPRLNGATVKQLILDGAHRGGRTAGVIPILNARESLVLAGRRPGAPLCGSRLWSAGGTVYAQRDTASRTGEALFMLPPSSRGSTWFSINALHGGKLIHAEGAGTYMRQWTPAGWANAPLPPAGTYPAGSNATMYSRYASSHGGDSSVTVVTDRTSPNVVTFSFRLTDKRTTTSQILPYTITAPYSTGSNVCLRQLTNATPEAHQRVADSEDVGLKQAFADFQQWVQTRPCTANGGSDGFRYSRGWAVYAPRGDRAYIFVTEQAGGTTLGGWVACTGATHALQWDSLYWNMPVEGQCRNSATSSQSAGTKIYELALPSGVVTPMSWGEAQAELRIPALREDGKEWVVDRFTRSEGWKHEWVAGSNWPKRTSYPTSDSCVVQYRTVASGSVLLEPSGALCEQNAGDRGISASQQPGLP